MVLVGDIVAAAVVQWVWMAVHRQSAYGGTMSWGLRQRIVELEDKVRALQDERQWLINHLESLTQLQREPMKADVDKVLMVMRGDV